MQQNQTVPHGMFFETKQYSYKKEFLSPQRHSPGIKSEYLSLSIQRYNAKEVLMPLQNYQNKELSYLPDEKNDSYRETLRQNELLENAKDMAIIQ